MLINSFLVTEDWDFIKFLKLKLQLKMFPQYQKQLFLTGIFQNNIYPNVILIVRFLIFFCQRTIENGQVANEGESRLVP